MAAKIIIGSKDKYTGEYINTTSNSKTWSRGLSPFLLGPVKLYGNYRSINVENAYQFCKLYPEHADDNRNPTAKYYAWAMQGWNNPVAQRYPMTKDAKPICSIWNGEKLGYIEARKRIYIPLYAKALVRSPVFNLLKQEYLKREQLVLWDFDGYRHEELGMTYADVINNPNRTLGHAFVIAMVLEGKIIVNGESVVIKEML